jgi:glyoxylase-like metal-dependent hydrolase (beta-lactamase superfamily II)
MALRMDRIPIPEQDIVPLERIASDLTGLRILVDCGLPHSHDRIQRWVDAHFGDGARPEFIVLTHGHFDHAGSVEWLAADWSVPVYVHPLELPYLTGKSEYPPPDLSVGGGLMSLLARLYPRGPVDITPHARVLPASPSKGRRHSRISRLALDSHARAYTGSCFAVPGKRSHADCGRCVCDDETGVIPRGCVTAP